MFRQQQGGGYASVDVLWGIKIASVGLVFNEMKLKQGSLKWKNC